MSGVHHLIRKYLFFSHHSVTKFTSLIDYGKSAMTNQNFSKLCKLGEKHKESVVFERERRGTASDS
jgi:hypothetical protein